MNMKRALCAFLVSGVMMTSVAAGGSATSATQSVCVAQVITGVIGAVGGEFFAENAVLPDALDGGAGEYIAPRASNDDCP